MIYHENIMNMLRRRWLVEYVETDFRTLHGVETANNSSQNSTVRLQQNWKKVKDTKTKKIFHGVSHALSLDFHFSLSEEVGRG